VIQKKICLVGAYAVGKTSLVQRFVKSIFSEKYHATIGVKIDKKVVAVGEREVTLVIWDLAGEDEFIDVELDYLRGTAGYLLVADGTRRSTLDRAVAMQQRAVERIGAVPFLLLINKADLEADWEITGEELGEMAGRGWAITRTSAKSGLGVEMAFRALAASLL
jgi:small GTP-binding protein